GCSYSSESVYLGANVGLNFSKPIANVSVGPNPISENSSLTVFVEGLVHSKVRIRISDIRGNQVYQKTIKSNEFPYQISNKLIRELNNGVYYLEVITNDQKSIKKIMKFNF
ncbi:MAG: T9SS type A sorting domain-containing protein, partial [Flavobacteriales bacterium]|nr:T9SS type A sorting domain-containing protein [Flavobacteriales bacterium]